MNHELMMFLHWVLQVGVDVSYWPWAAGCLCLFGVVVGKLGLNVGFMVLLFW